ncbi:MAG: YkvA family protein [Henriciella sp.]
MTDTPSIRIEFELTESDIDYFRERLKTAQKKFAKDGESKIVYGAESLIKQTEGATVPGFLVPRIENLRVMIAMLRDKDWRLEGEDRAHVINALAYFADPQDMVPDAIPGIGMLDDAIMIDLATRELRPELDAYAEFCDNREELQAGAPDADPLHESRNILQKRMQRQRRREVRRGRRGSGSYSLFH